MKKLLMALLIVFSVFALASCDINDVLSNIGIGNPLCQHRDADYNGTCDKCGVDFTDGIDKEICNHRDTDDNGKCDSCGANYTDGIDKSICNHRDADDNFKCDKCGVNFSDEADIQCQHRDKDDDFECDYCGDYYIDGKDTYLCQHRDGDDNGKCDKCQGSYSDGVDVPSAPECEHDFDILTVAPTCESRGYYEKECKLCGVVIRGDIINALGHDMGEPVVDVAPTCTDDGSGVAYCQRECGYSKNVIIKTPGHIWDTDYSYDKTYHWKTCDNCDETTAKSEHTTDNSGYCTVCDQPVGGTEGVLYDKSGDGTYAEVIGYIGTAKRVVIADTYEDVPVKTIYKEAFKNTSISEVVIPDSVTTIGNSAFYNCDSLTTVSIGNSVTTIDSSTFYDCDWLTSAVIPDSVTSIGNSAFYSCYRLASIEIGDSVTSIGEKAFDYCDSLTSVVIPDSVTSIGNSAFYYCYGLKSVTINGSPDIGYDAFYGCSSMLYTEYKFGKYIGDADNPYAVLVELTNKNFSTYEINERTKIIAYGVFKECERLTSVVIPDSVTNIGERAFYDCDGLTSVVIGDSVTSIGEKAFDRCYNLTSATLPTFAISYIPQSNL